jgi:hypothetical protein
MWKLWVHNCKINPQRHTSYTDRFSENFDYKAETHPIFFVGMHWFQKYNFWKNDLSPLLLRLPRANNNRGSNFIKSKNKRQSISVTVKNWMKNKMWPQWPRKWPLDLNNLGRGSVIFFKYYISFKSGQSRTCYKLSSYADILMIGLCIE